MKKISLLFVILVLYCQNAFSFYLPACHNTGGVTSTFENCINQNFRSIERELGFSVHLFYCSNTGSSGVSTAFESCINRNFQDIDRLFEYSLYLTFCRNFGNDVSYSFESCINGNFWKVERAVETGETN